MIYTVVSVIGTGISVVVVRIVSPSRPIALPNGDYYLPASDETIPAAMATPSPDETLPSLFLLSVRQQV